MNAARAGATATIQPLPTFVARRRATLTVVVSQLKASERKPVSFGPFAVVPERQLWSTLHIRRSGRPLPA